MGGTYREVTPPTRLVFTWVWEQGDIEGQETVVTAEFNERDGGTEISITHEGFKTTESRDQHGWGWNSSLDCLTKEIVQ